MKYYVVLDTNVLVSAMLRWQSVPGTLLSLAFDGPVIPLLHESILSEYREVLHRPKFHLPDDVIETVIESLLQNGICVNAAHVEEEWPDPKDRIFYEVVMEKRKETDAWLVTGNGKHFPVRPYVVTPREMLDIILGTAGSMDAEKHNL